VAVAVATRPPRADRAIDEAIRVIPTAWFRPTPIIYWSDLLISAAIGWTALAFATTGTGWTRTGWLAVAILALYRAVLFIHEITHLNHRDVPAFTAAWNAIVGVPLLIPSFLYEGVHTDHHRQRCYGTEADPEYVPFGLRPPALAITTAASALLAPLVFAVRFGILAPISWLVPPLGRWVFRRGSALVMNHRYVRHTPIDLAGRVEEVAACVFTWAAAWLVWSGRLPYAALGCWAIATSAASGINAVRTLAAHRYRHDSGELSMTDQLLDSCTLPPTGGASAVADFARALIAPVGLRYHALHHWIPSLPYHNLGRAHRLLVTTLAADAPYRSTLSAGLTPALTDLLRRSRAR
jgi:fatty acid desaturase